MVPPVPALPLVPAGARLPVTVQTSGVKRIVSPAVVVAPSATLTLFMPTYPLQPVGGRAIAMMVSIPVTPTGR